MLQPKITLTKITAFISNNIDIFNSMYYNINMEVYKYEI